MTSETTIVEPTERHVSSSSCSLSAVPLQAAQQATAVPLPPRAAAARPAAPAPCPGPGTSKAAGGFRGGSFGPVQPAAVQPAVVQQVQPAAAACSDGSVVGVSALAAPGGPPVPPVGPVGPEAPS